MSLDEPEPVDSVLTFLSGYDILKYLWVKATMVSVHLWILFVTLHNTNNRHVYLGIPLGRGMFVGRHRDQEHDGASNTET